MAKRDRSDKKAISVEHGVLPGHLYLGLYKITCFVKNSQNKLKRQGTSCLLVTVNVS